MSTTKTTGWTGWVVFAGVILMTVGIFNAVQGLVALIGPSSYYVLTEGSLWLLDVTGWGWWNLIIGLLLVLVAVALLAGQTWARVVAVILVILNAVGASASHPCPAVVVRDRDRDRRSGHLRADRPRPRTARGPLANSGAL